MPPQTIISLSVHTAVWPYRASGALVVLVALQLSVLGSYLPPVLNIRAGMVSPTGVAVTSSTPNDHFTAGPDCRVAVSGRGRVRGAGGCPTVGAWVVPPASVKKRAATPSTPDDHLAASPNRCVEGSGSGGIGECRWSPRVIGAATRGISYYRKLVGAVHLNRLSD